jgi:hypothetical protein
VGYTALGLGEDLLELVANPFRAGYEAIAGLAAGPSSTPKP